MDARVSWRSRSQRKPALLLLNPQIGIDPVSRRTSIRHVNLPERARRAGKASECICVIITTRSTAKAIMRVIVWLTKRPGQNDNGTLLFDQRTRVIAVAMKRSRMRRILPIRYRNRRIARNAERTTRQTGDPTSTERAQRIRDGGRRKRRKRRKRERG